VLNASLGPGCTGRDYTLRKAKPPPWWSWLVAPWSRRAADTYRLPPRDEYGGVTLARIKDHGVNSIADAAAQSCDHVIDFYRRLRFELGFYVACLNLHDALRSRGVPTAIPQAADPMEAVLRCVGLVDAGLALRARRPLVGNDVNADGKRLIVLTGANQGGKSTLLRALGLAQLMLDAGLFITAESYHGSASLGVFSHYRREEDTALEHGKLEDELARMSSLVDRLRPGSVLVMDESFASTNEREGSEIASGIVEVLLAAGIRIYYVTHLYALSHALAERGRPEHLFLRAQRDNDTQRTFILAPGDPESTSYARDLLAAVFADG
jgi:DNA mismatch repair ATPase MutS